jgi:acyl-CoA synthetase (AMP-forming)/AMP-acid ligase II
VAAVLGTLQAGCVVATLHHSFDRRKLVLQLNDCAASALFTDRIECLDGLLAETSLRLAVSAATPAPQADERIVAFHDLPAGAGAPPAGSCGAERLGAVFYTSGSSSHPKGVLVNHGNMLAAFECVTGTSATRPTTSC